VSIFISPHNDDETLFGAFTILRERPLVVIVFDSHVQEARGLRVDWKQRRHETRKALDILGGQVCYLGLSDADPGVTEAVIREALFKTLGRLSEPVFAPASEEAGHAQHNMVAEATAFPGVRRYLTYTARGKSIVGRPVPIESPDWIRRKLEALACYTSQFSLDPRMGCYPHFLRDQTEYYL
jgi:LmbE family N-acetylglucosaminyl deacetylase